LRGLLITAAATMMVAGPAWAQDAGDPHAGHGAMEQMDHDAPSPPPAPKSPPPPAPSDWAGDAIHDPAAMAAARKDLFAQTSDMTSHLVLVDRLEWQPRGGHDGLRWSGMAFWGGDLDRLVIRSEGEAELGGDLDKAELRALWSHAIGPNFNLEAGVRQDLEPGPRRTHATVGVDGMLPYWIELEAALFLSTHGEVQLRAEFSHDMRLTNALILQPRAEFNLSAQDMPLEDVGSGLSDMELGLRLRYAAEPTFAPYVGVDWERKFGGSARFARAAGENPSVTSFVAGVRFFF
jgi:copper resistance protein B